MSRKIDKSRLYKVIQVCVYLVVAYLLFWSYNAYTNRMYPFEWMDKCVAEQRYIGTEEPNLYCIGHYGELRKEYGSSVAMDKLAIAVGILILFHGGTALISYLAPEERK